MNIHEDDLPDCMSKDAKAAISTARMLCEVLERHGRNEEAKKLGKKILRIVEDASDILNAIYHNKQLCGSATARCMRLDELDMIQGFVKERGYSNRWIE